MNVAPWFFLLGVPSDVAPPPPPFGEPEQVPGFCVTDGVESFPSADTIFERLEAPVGSSWWLRSPRASCNGDGSSEVFFNEFKVVVLDRQFQPVDVEVDARFHSLRIPVPAGASPGDGFHVRIRDPEGCPGDTDIEVGTVAVVDGAPATAPSTFGDVTITVLEPGECRGECRATAACGSDSDVRLPATASMELIGGPAIIDVTALWESDTQVLETPIVSRFVNGGAAELGSLGQHCAGLLRFTFEARGIDDGRVLDTRTVEATFAEPPEILALPACEQGQSGCGCTSTQVGSSAWAGAAAMSVVVNRLARRRRNGETYAHSSSREPAPGGAKQAR